MADEEAAKPTLASTIKKDRSPSFPFITLTKSVDRARELYAAAKRHEMRLPDAAAAMGYGAKSSGAVQTLAALISFGLVEDSGSGDARKFKLTDLGFKLLEDQRPGAREAALAQAAMTPKMIAEYGSRWKDGRPADGICISELRIDGNFTEDGAKTFLRVFDDAMGYAKVGDSGSKTDTSRVDAEARVTPSEEVAVGDLVNVEIGGALTLKAPAKIRAIQEHEGQQWVFVEGSETGFLMTDAILVEKAAPGTPLKSPPLLALPAIEREQANLGEEMDRFTVDEGVVKIVFPSGMTVDSVDELEQFFQLFIKKAKRRAGADKKSN